LFRPRLIPVLLLSNGRLVKTKGFKKPVYIGDPLNAVRIFNELRADELIILDIEATHQKKSISPDVVKQIGEEANMPISVGGGICDLKVCEQLIQAGAERLVLSSYAIQNPAFIEQAAQKFGASTISVCIDYKRNLFGKKVVFTHAGAKSSKLSPEETAIQAANAGAGEVVIQSIQHDGCMSGYDLETIQKVSELVNIPVIALGGAGSIQDFANAFLNANATGLAAGSFFVFKGAQRGVLINYPASNLRTFVR